MSYTPIIEREQVKTFFLLYRELDPKFTLRHFAKELGISHTLLSLFFSGKRNCSIGIQSRMLIFMDNHSNQIVPK